jgi:hypothetical protein
MATDAAHALVGDKPTDVPSEISCFEVGKTDGYATSRPNIVANQTDAGSALDSSATGAGSRAKVGSLKRYS